MFRLSLWAGAAAVAAGLGLGAVYTASAAEAQTAGDDQEATSGNRESRAAAVRNRRPAAPSPADRTPARQAGPVQVRASGTPPSIGLDFSTTYASPAPSYQQAAQALSQSGITRLRMYDVIPDALSAIQASIPTARVTVAVPNGSVPRLVSDATYAASVLDSLAPYKSVVDTIVVGNEVDQAFGGDLSQVTAAVKNMQDAIVAQGLPIATTVSFTMGVVTGSYPPSNATLNTALPGLTDLLDQLTDHVEIDIYPLITMQETPVIPLAYALGSATCTASSGCAVVDGDVTYNSLFWAQYDAVRWALNKANISLPLYVGETGWATNSVGGAYPNASVTNAAAYNQNLINSVLTTGSPKFGVSDFPVHLFEFIDESQKTGGIFEPYWGWQQYTGGSIVPKYSLNFSSSMGARPRDGRVPPLVSTRVVARNGWKAVGIIGSGDDPRGDGFAWAMPGNFDGLGAQLVDGATLRVQVNHELLGATISQVDLNLAALQAAIAATINKGRPGRTQLVSSARQAYGRWSADGGSTWTTTEGPATTAFSRFCSGQSYRPDSFGAGRGFVDDVYITGEEVGRGRLFALDLANRDLYQLSGVTGDAGGGVAGMPFDSWENAALVDTGETEHVALLLSPDGGTRRLALYIGEKGKNAAGAAASDFLSRNGLAYGSYYYLTGSFPAVGAVEGGFGTTASDALSAAKLEDVDTSPGDPTRVAIGVQETGLFTFGFRLDFTGGGFDPAASSFTLTAIQGHANDTDGSFGDADNVDWTAPTGLGGQSLPDGLIFVNEDSATGNGETWVMRPDGSGLTKIADTIGIATAGETSGILDISELVGYRPGSVLLTSNQGATSSLTMLINPLAG